MIDYNMCQDVEHLLRAGKKSCRVFLVSPTAT